MAISSTLVIISLMETDAIFVDLYDPHVDIDLLY
jgi:hypothetical protein